MPLLLALTLIAQTPPAAPTPRLGAEVVRPAGGPLLLLHTYATPLVAFRLAAPLPPGLPEGTAELLQELARPEASREAARIGATLELDREDERLVVRLTGPARSFDDLVAVLRRVTREPDLSTASLTGARARAEDRVLAALERPEPRLRRLLIAELGGRRTISGFAAGDLGPEAIRAFRDRIYDPATLRVTIVGVVAVEAAHAAFADWPAGAGAVEAGVLPTAPAPPASHPVGPWAALAYPMTEPPAVLAVAAALVARRVETSALRSGGAEAWQGRFGAALVVIGGAGPADPTIAAASASTRLPLRAGRRASSPTGPYLRRMIGEALALAGPEGVASAALEIQRGLLLEARTPVGRAEVIGRFSDLSLDPEEFLDRLGGVQLADVRRVLESALAAPALLVEVVP